MRVGDSERLDKGKTVPFNMAGLMQVVMRLPSGPAVQSTEPKGLEWKPGLRLFGGHGISVNIVAIW